MLEDINTAVSLSYTLSLDGNSLGSFSTCEGLGLEVVLESREEGGMNNFVWQFPTRLKYSNITLTRPLGRDTKLVTDWIETMTAGYNKSEKYKSTGTIVVMRGPKTPVASWSLFNVVPVRWKGPSLNPDQAKVLTESLEIAHHGFTVQGH